MRKFEYEILELKGIERNNQFQHLNSMGEQGWELINQVNLEGLLSGMGVIIFYFKREIK